MTVERILPAGEARDLLDLATDLADRELAPKVTDFEARGEFPREVIRAIGRAGLLGTTRRRSGRRQLTYAGRPMYHYVADAPGRILCHDVAEFGGTWLVLRPDGTAAP